MLLEKFKAAKMPEVEALHALAAEGNMPLPIQEKRPDFLAALKCPANNSDLAVIAEFKQASPSRGVIIDTLSPEDVAKQYAHAGASCISVLTEHEFFGGELGYLDRMSSQGIPLLRKDFIFDELQVVATAATPASALLLIVRLTPDAAILRRLRELAESYGIHAVVEIFDEPDLLLARESGARIIQVNARDLDTLKTDRNICLDLAQHKQEGEVWIAASAMDKAEHLKSAKLAGYDAALMGTALMEKGTPGDTLARILTSYRGHGENVQSLAAGVVACSHLTPRGAKLRVKICGISRLSDLDTCMSMGAHFCGFIFHPHSPRFVSPSRARLLRSAHLKRVGIFVDQQQDEINRIMKEAKLHYAQLHGKQSIECANAIGADKVIRVLWPQKYPDLKSLQEDINHYADSCSWFLLDAGKEGGGSGKTLNWEELAKLDMPKPWILAGGLSPESLAKALASCSPDGVDLNSGLEWAPGQKSAKAVLSAMRIIQQYQQNLPLAQ